jgi:aminopeptidase N
MNFHKRALSCLAAGLFVAFLSSQSVAQKPRADFNRPQTFDVQNYTIRVSFDRTKRKVFGDTTVDLTPLRSGFSEAILDAADMVFSSVTLEPEGAALKYRTAGEKIIVGLDRAYSPGDKISLRFKYVSSPKKGVYFVDQQMEGGKVIAPAQIWTQGEADEAHHWIPSFDFPSDKATTEQFITTETGETVVANGELVDKKDNGDGTTTFHYRMTIPHSIYLLSFVIGKYAKVEDAYNGIPLGFYVYPGTEAIVPSAYGRTKEMLKVFEELTGVKYPYNKYDQTVVAGFTFGGMENITATTMADSEIYLANLAIAKAGVEDLVSHELSHSWFGDLVTCKNWAELWLNEGFATFMEAAFRERMYGRRNYIIKVKSDAETFIVDDAVNPNRNALFNQNAGNVAALFDRPATIYNKGGAVLHTLREEVGDAAFWKAINLYLTRHKFGSVESTDLQKAMEEVSGRDLEWFFSQWVYSGGLPKLEVRQTYDSGSKTLRLTVVQVQKADKITPAAFRLPIDVEIKTAEGTKTEHIEVDKRSETFSIKLDGHPESLRLDPEEKIPVKTVKIHPIAAKAAK